MNATQKFQAAFESRKAFLESLALNKTNAFRAFGGEPEGISGLTLDVFGSVGILNFYEGKCRLAETELRSIAKTAANFYSLSSLYLKKFISNRSNKDLETELLKSTPFLGEEAPSSLLVQENGASFEIHPYDGYSVGLFLDQRENRKFIGEHSKGKKILNLFSYTCGFSVMAALNGGNTVSVDASKKYLDWGKRNFALNNLSLDCHKFILEDVGLYLQRLVKRGETFDLIVLDPPSFGRSSKGVFSLEKDLPKILEHCLLLLNPHGLLHVSCNYQKWGEGDLKELVDEKRRVSGRAGNRLKVVHPFDFSKEENPLSSVILRIS